MKETRAHIRYELRVSAEVHLAPGVSITCVTRDLSEGGLGIEADRALASGQTVGVELFVVVDDIEDEATTPLQLAARVAWCRPQGDLQHVVGLQFVDLDPPRREYLLRLLRAVPTPAARTAP